jgi:hypothetical protein
VDYTHAAGGVGSASSLCIMAFLAYFDESVDDDFFVLTR